MAIKFLSGQTISGTLTVSGNVQGATFNGLPIETSQTNNNVNKIVRTTVNGYVNFGWINSISGNHTGAITRITASNDQYLRYVTPAQFRTGVTDGFYAPSSTVSGVTSVGGTGTVSGITLTGTVTSTGNLTLGGTLSASITNISNASNWWNNFGDVHGTRTGFDASTASYSFGWRYVQGNTNGPGTGGTQFYSAYVGLGSQYPATGSGSYGAYLAFDRNVANPYLSIRYNEANVLGTWKKISAGTADILTTARTIAGVSFNGSANISLNNNAITNGAGYTTNTGTVTSVATGSGLTGGTITTTGTLSLDRPNSQLGAVLATYGTTAGASGRVRCTAPFNTNSSKMFSIEVTLYTNYTQHNYVVSAYMYSTTNQWYSPKAIYTTTGTATPDIYVGRDGNGKAYISIANSSYTGVLVHNMTRGYTTSLANTYEPWTITIDGGNENSTSVAVSTVYTSSNLPAYPSVGNGQIDGRTSGLGISGSMDATANQTGNTTFTVTSNAATAATASTIAYRDSAADINVRLLRANYQDQGTISGAIAFRVNNSSDNYTRYCSSPSAIRTFIGAGTGSGTVTSVATGNGITGGTITTTGTLTMSGSYTGTFTATSLASNSFLNNAGSLLFLAGNTTTGASRSLNLRHTSGDPSSADGSNSTGITWGQRTDSNPYYIIKPTQLNFGGGNYSKLTLNWHTGIRIGGQKNYGGTKFYNDAPDIVGETGVIMNVGVGNDNIGVVNNLTVGSNLTFTGQNLRSTVGLFLQVDSGNVNAITIDNVGSTTFSGYTYFPNYLFHTGDTNTRIEFTTGTVTLRGDTSILLDGPVTANSTMTVASTLTTSGQITANGVIYLKDRITLPASGLSSVSGRPAYNIYQEGGAWTSPFPDLCIAMHTGIKFGAHASYNGMRFYDDYTMATQVMSINNSSDPLGANNVYVTNSLQAGSSLRAPIFYDSNDTAYYGNFASTSNFNTLTLAGSLTVQSGSGTMNGKATQLFEHGYGSDSGTFYQTSGSFAGYSGWANYWIGNHGNGATYYNTVDIRPFWGPPKYSRLEGGTFRGPYNYVTNENDQTIGVYLQSTTSLRAPIFYDYNNTAFYLDPSTTGTSVNVAGDVVAYASSDIRFKNNITPITNALDKLSKIGGYTFEWNEISHKETGKKDIGVVAQEVEEILPEIVQTRSNGYKAVDYQKLTALLIESVKEQQFIIDDLQSRIERLEKI